MINTTVQIPLHTITAVVTNYFCWHHGILSPQWFLMSASSWWHFLSWRYLRVGLPLKRLAIGPEGLISFPMKYFRIWGPKKLGPVHSNTKHSVLQGTFKTSTSCMKGCFVQSFRALINDVSMRMGLHYISVRWFGGWTVEPNPAWSHAFLRCPLYATEMSSDKE